MVLSLVALVAMSFSLPSRTASASPPLGNTVSLSSTVASVGDVVVVSGQQSPACAPGSQLLFRGVSGPTSQGGILLFPASGAGASWSSHFAIPAYLPESRTSGSRVTPGTYEFVNSCLNAPAAVAMITVSSSFAASRFVAMSPVRLGGGYWLAQAGGGVFSYGTATFAGSLPGLGVVPAAPIVGMASTFDGKGYWLVSSDGGVYAFGDARYLGSLPGLGVVPTAPIVGIAAAATGNGYWLLGADGGVFAFGVPYFGSANGGGFAAEPFSSISAYAAPTLGYVVASQYDDSIVAFSGSGARLLRGPTVVAGQVDAFIGISAQGPVGPAAWTVQTNGGVYTYQGGGGVPSAFYGSLPGEHVVPAAPVSAVAATPDGRGYWLLGGDGGVFCFGDAGFFGSAT